MPDDLPVFNRALIEMIREWAAKTEAAA
jgi:hypothetical protein